MGMQRGEQLTLKQDTGSGKGHRGMVVPGYHMAQCHCMLCVGDHRLPAEVDERCHMAFA